MSTAHVNPLLSSRMAQFLLYEVLHVDRLCRLPAFADHDRDTFDEVLRNAQRLARDVLFPAYAAMDKDPPRFAGGVVSLHRAMHDIYPRLVETGFLTASRPAAVGGLSLPLVVAGLASAYLMAGNLSAYAFIGLTSGAAHLIESFGSDKLKAEFMTRMYAGEWTGTMALTEPQAGSSLADVKCVATPTEAGHYLIRGAKIFISAGDHDLCENIVHLLLARISGAPAGTKGISLFAVPKRRLEGGNLVANDVHAAGVIHKIGWRGVPSLVMSYGEQDDCHGFLVGEPHRGLSYMFQMMNEARLMVGWNAAATASAAYHEALGYARTRRQGRPMDDADPAREPVAIIEHPDVRRMLLRQKAIVEGSLALLARTAMYADLAAHADTAEEQKNAALLLDLLTPVAKSFPAERGFEAGALAVQVHGGYGYSSEFLVEAFLRDQKLNSIHEGTTGIQSLDLLGRRIGAGGDQTIRAFEKAVHQTIVRARGAGVRGLWIEQLSQVLSEIDTLTDELLARRRPGELAAMLRHSADFLELFGIAAVAWQWLEMAASAREQSTGDDDFYQGILCAAQYFFATEVPRVHQLVELCRVNEDSYARMQPAWF